MTGADDPRGVGPVATRGGGGSSALGMAAGFGAYTLWGLFPLYFHNLDPASPLEILAHRVVWTMLLMFAVLGATGRLSTVADAYRDTEQRRIVVLAGWAIAFNWLTYVWAVANDRVVDASLGYFINPLTTVAVGVIVLREPIRLLQKLAIALGGAAVVVLVVAHREFPLIGLLLAGSFSSYSLLKKRVRLRPIVSLAAETTAVAPFAAVGLTVSVASGSSAFLHTGAGLSVRLFLLGIVTATPLLLFAVAAHRLTLVTLGVMQYITPFAIFLIGWLYFGEEVPPARLAGFVFIWAALVVLTIDAFRSTARTRRARRTAPVSIHTTEP